MAALQVFNERVLLGSVLLLSRLFDAKWNEALSASGYRLAKRSSQTSHVQHIQWSSLIRSGIMAQGAADAFHA